MSEHAPAAPDAPHPPHAEGHHTNYVKIWAILCGLLVVSVIGPMFGVQWLTLITAFGIACVKAYLVATRFMHVNVEKRLIPYMLGAMLALMALMVGAVSPDVMKHEGARWENVAAKHAVEKGLAAQEHGGGEHGGGAKGEGEHH